MNPRIAPEHVTRILVLGGGTIGAGWTAYFTWRGFEVRVVDPHIAQDRLATEVTRNLTVLRQLGQPAPEGRYEHFPSLAAASRAVDFVQEAVVEDLGVKQRLLARLEPFLAASTVICSSTSALMPSDIQATCRYPDRVLVGHPFNPPHLLPLVEVAPGRQTAPEAVAWTMRFYRHVGKHAIQVKQEVKGHIANRLTSALFREAVHLLAEGVATVEDLDAAITYGPGLRWALTGPFLTYHLGGGAAGIEGYLAHLGDTHPARWARLGAPNLNAETREAIVRGVLQAYGEQSWTVLGRRRDHDLVELLRLRQRPRQALDSDSAALHDNPP